MARSKEQPLPASRSRQELAAHFMQQRLQEARRKAEAFLQSLDPRHHTPGAPAPPLPEGPEREAAGRKAQARRA
ncbi:MAG: hypothetical protein HY823_15350 [Acidobacteria bacterium]|nr:hypothetical protein [Acidobacteriota bacterium]